MSFLGINISYYGGSVKLLISQCCKNDTQHSLGGGVFFFALSKKIQGKDYSVFNCSNVRHNC